MSARKKGIRVLVIGSGAIGLTTTLELLNRGYDVTVVASSFPSFSELSPSLASEASGAIWCPPETIDNITVEEVSAAEVRRFKKWAAVSGERFAALAENPTVTGVSIQEHVILHNDKIRSAELAKLSNLPGFKHSLSPVHEFYGLHGMPKHIKDGYTYSAPFISPTNFLAWLYQECKRKGAHYIQCTIRGSLGEQAEALRVSYGVHFIVNCSGLGASKLVGDKNLFPLGGALLLAQNDGQCFPFVDKVYICNFHVELETDETGQSVDCHILVMPRGEDKVAIGSFYQPYAGEKKASRKYRFARKMLEESQRSFPPLKNLKIEDCWLIFGVRPARKGGVCLEVDNEKPFIVHNYGHSRWGMTFSWGSAIDVVKLIDKGVATQPSWKAKL